MTDSELIASLRQRLADAEDAVNVWRDEAANNGRLGSVLTAQVMELQSKVERAQELLADARCPNCDGIGFIARQFAAGEWEQEGCQWCFEKHLLAATEPSKAQPQEDTSS